MSSQPIYFSQSPPPIVNQYSTQNSLGVHSREEKFSSRGKDMTRRHFSDYQNGRRMISELPKFKYKASRERFEGKEYGQSFKLPHRDGTQSQMYQKIEKFFTRTVQQIEKIQKDRYEAHVPKKQSERDLSSLNIQGQMRITRASRSLQVPSFIQRDLNMTREASFYLSRRRSLRIKTDGSYRACTNMRELIKQRKKEEKDNLLGIIEGLTVEKKELISGKTQKDLINKNKLLNYPKKNRSFFRAIDSRIEPWSFFTNDGEHQN